METIERGENITGSQRKRQEANKEGSFYSRPPAINQRSGIGQPKQSYQGADL